MKGRTIILVSHHVQLCAPLAHHIVTLDNGRVVFQGDYKSFTKSESVTTLTQNRTSPSDPTQTEGTSGPNGPAIDDVTLLVDQDTVNTRKVTPNVDLQPTNTMTKKTPRKLIEEEKRAVGRIGREIWKTYIVACGRWSFWSIFAVILVLTALNPVLLNGWVR